METPIFDIKNCIKDNMENVYIPIEINGKLIFDGRQRFYDVQRKRLDLFPDFSGDSIFDFGCNTGFILKKIKQDHNAGLCVGVDIDPYIIKIANSVSYYESINDLLYFGLDITKGDRMPGYESFIFDHSLLLSIANNENQYYGLVFSEVIDRLKKITKKSIFIEPTNHEKKSVDDLKKIYSKFFSKWGEPEFLGVTDYQNRVMFRVHFS